MSEIQKNPFDPFFDEIRRIVREEIKVALANGNGQVKVKKEWLKAEELTKEYGLPKTWFEVRGRAGDIARTKPGRYVLFRRRDVDAYLESRLTCASDLCTIGIHDRAAAKARAEGTGSESSSTSRDTQDHSDDRSEMGAGREENFRASRGRRETALGEKRGD